MDENIRKQFDLLSKRILKIEKFLESLNFRPYSPSSLDNGEKDQLFEEAVKLVVKHNRASSSLLQRRLAIGFNHAARLLEQLEEVGVVGPADGSEPREVLIKNPDEFLKKRNSK